MNNFYKLGAADTTIGTAFRKNQSRRFPAVGVSVSVLIIDFTLGVKFIDPIFRISYALIGIGLLFLLADGDLKSLGLSFKPKQKLQYWFNATVAAGLIGGAIIAVAAGIVTLSGGEIIRGKISDSHAFLETIWYACVVAPLVEEPLYRLIFASGFKGVFSSKVVIVLGGLVFALLHVAYGNPDIDNAIGGFILTWAFLKSESILVPIALHALGNLCVIISWIF